jgi:50S ribosomal subunit-associated GTPase HflX
MRNLKSNNPENSDSFRGKTLQEYKSDYPDLIEYFKKRHIDNDEINFIDREIRLIKEFIKPIIESQKSELEEQGEIDLINFVIESNLSSYNKIIFFLETKKLEFEPESTFPELLDLSETSAVKKIIYLNELGIIDFLKSKPEFIGSTNLMATFLSAITGVKTSTLQPSLNKLISEDIDDQRHPYRTQSTVNEVRQTLIDKNIKPKTS